jgi:hypothetical protein
MAQGNQYARDKVPTSVGDSMINAPSFGHERRNYIVVYRLNLQHR